MDNLFPLKPQSTTTQTSTPAFSNTSIQPVVQPYNPVIIPQTSTVDIPKTIPSDTLSYKAPQDTAIETPINTPSKNLDALSGAIMSSVQTPVTPPTERELAIKDRQSAIDQYLNPDTGYSATSLKLQTESGLPEKQSQLDALNVKDIALQKQLKDYQDQILNKNAQGLFGGAGQQAISQYERDISSQRADLAIQKLALQGDIKGATSLINLKLDAKFKPIEDRIDYLDKTLTIYNNDLTEKQKQQMEIEKYKLQTDIKNKEDFQKIVDEAGTQGASIDIQNQAANLFAKGDRAGAISLLSPYSKNAKESFGGYNETQNKVITSTNDKIAKSTTYQKAVNVSGYVDSALANLKNNTGASDIAAINQFQKVVDEGAVTRDQDVVLLQSSQSLLNSLLTKVNKLAKGQQLSPQLRDEMRQAMNSMKEAAVGAVNDDPYIKAQTSQLERYGIKPEDTIIGEINQKYNQATTIPADDELMKKYNLTPDQLQQYKQSRGLTSVGSDTNQATKGKEIVAGYDITSYATDPTHGIKVQKIYSNIPEVSDTYISKVAPNSPIKANTVIASANKYGVDPKLVLAIMVQDSTLGTKGLAVRTKNPGNVGNTDSGATRTYGSWDEGVDAVAKNLAWRKINKTA